MTGLLDLLVEPFGYQFMVKAILGGGAVGAVCAVLSCFVTLKGWSLLGDALSHAVVPGVAIAYLAGAPFLLGAVLSGLFAVLGIGAIERATKLRGDAVIGVVFTAFFALGLLLISLYPSNLRLTTILFGNLLGIADADLWQLFAVGAGCLLVVAAKWKDLLLYCFDAQHARAIGLPTGRLHLLLLGLLSLTAVAALQAVGALLVVAMLITPGATAFLLTDRFPRMLVLAAVMGAVTAMAGAYASYFLDGSTGGLIVLAQTALFLLALALAPKHGLLRRAGVEEAVP
ncbi:metal ABC transporter permease [Inquilinus limosus]|uniref:Membrane protein n=1 Tax=Inquilinus limosus MP06 TaxID=1398085 RepID=A0A0A0DB83_9PROT|nr:metal ABC transporter permease [Inquilinus limosus]KGM35280.1 membrane protein [Inquilinus limosus MP06]